MPGPAKPGKRGAVELLHVNQSLGDADHPPVVVLVTLHGASALRQPVVRRWWSGLRCVGAKLSKRLFTISGETVNTCSVLHVREMPEPHAQRLPRLATFSRGRC